MKYPRQKDEQYLNKVRQLPCIICMKPSPSHAAHIRAAAPQYNKRATGMAEKPHDAWTLPLCANHHTDGPGAQHRTGNEENWWRDRGIDPFTTAIALYEARGSHTAMLSIICRANIHSTEVDA